MPPRAATRDSVRRSHVATRSKQHPMIMAQRAGRSPGGEASRRSLNGGSGITTIGTQQVNRGASGAEVNMHSISQAAGSGFEPNSTTLMVVGSSGTQKLSASRAGQATSSINVNETIPNGTTYGLSRRRGFKRGAAVMQASQNSTIVHPQNSTQ